VGARVGGNTPPPPSPEEEEIHQVDEKERIHPPPLFTSTSLNRVPPLSPLFLLSWQSSKHSSSLVPKILFVFISLFFQQENSLSPLLLKIEREYTSINKVRTI
jgi:hypothetical protein